MQMDYICFLEFRQIGDIRTRIGHIDFKEMFAAEMQMQPYDKPFP